MDKKNHRKAKSFKVVTEFITLNSMEPILVGEWIIKISGNQHGNLLVVMFNYETKEAVTHYFKDEMDATAFINVWIEKHS